jgi:hypothetical protein
MPLSKTKTVLRPLPSPLSLRKLLGPSFILLGLGLGSGEIILWPYLSSNYGLGIVWGMLAGITMQFFINMEVSRYALIYGESIFVGFARLLRLLPLWFIFSTFIGFGWPGIGLAGAELVTKSLGLQNTKLTAIIIFLAIGLILSLGRVLYHTVERLQKILISIGVPFIVLLTIYLARPADLWALARGLVGVGEGYLFLPSGILIGTFLGALAYAGAGGNLNLAQSFYVRDKGYGMGRYADKISSIFTGGGARVIRLTGFTFSPTKTNLSRFRQWWKVVNAEHLLIFWLLGLFTMLTLSLLAYTTAYGLPGNEKGINFVVNESKIIGLRTIPLLGTFFLLTLGIMLSATQLTVLDSTSRIITENLLLIRKKVTAKAAKLFYFILWLQISFGIAVFAAGFDQPRELITLGAILNAFAMFIYTGLLLYLNNRIPPPPLRPSLARNVTLICTFLFLGFFCFWTLVEKLYY